MIMKATDMLPDGSTKKAKSSNSLCVWIVAGILLIVIIILTVVIVLFGTGVL